MQLSSDILSQFAKVTKDETATKQESIVYGTIIESNGEKYVQIDGSDLLTPMASTTNMSDGERVTVMIKNHMAVVTGNVTSPAVRDGDVDDKVSDVKKLVVEDLKATNAEIENLKAQNAEIENLVAGKITVGQLNAVRAEIEELIAKKADIEHLDATYANIDFANISKAAMEYFYATSGLIKDVVIGDGTITGNLVGVTIKGDLIEGNTVVAEKLVIKGNDGLYYKLNTDGMKVEAEQTDYNSLNGSIITAKSITATKISVSDLVAFDATIGGFNITDSAIYSGVKESVDNTTRGIYMDKTGQFAFGDSNNFLKFYKDSNGAYKLEISAASIKMGTSGTNVETAINNVKNSVDNIQIGGRNYILGTGTPYTAVGNGSRQWLYPWKCASIAANRSLYGKTVTISFDYEEAITSGSLGVIVNDLWIGVKSFNSDTGSGHFTLTREHADFNTGSDVFIYIDGTWTGSVTFSNMKVEIGNKETDWSPAPEDTDAAIAEFSSAITLQAGEITSNATKIETVSQAAGKAQSSANAAQNTANAAQNAASGAQNTANAAQNAANSAQNAANGAVTRVTEAEQRISAVEGEITSKVSKTEFNTLGNTVSEMSTEIRQNEEAILLQASKKSGGTQLLKNGGFYGGLSNWSKLEYNVNGEWRNLYVEAPTPDNQYRSQEAPNLILHAQYETGMFGAAQTVKGLRKNTQYTISGYVASHRCNRAGIEIRDTTASRWAMNPVFDVGWGGTNLSAYNRFEYTFDTGDYADYQITLYSNNFQDNAYVWWAQIKLEEGNTATAWSPHPDDPASSVDAGGVVRVDQTGVHMSGGTIEMETTDGDEYIHIRNDGISASSLSAPNVAKRYSGPTGLYVNPNATSAQIAAGNYFRSISDALATINNRMLDYNVFVNMSSGMSDYADAVISGVYGDGSILIYGENATIYGTVTVRNSHAQVHISQLHVAIPSGVEHAAYDVRNAFLTAYTCTMSGNNKAFHVETNGYLDARSCVFRVNAEYSAYVLRSTASFENCIGNGALICHRANMTAYGNVPIGGASYWESCMPNNISSLVPTAADGTPAAPVISTVTYNYTNSDSYRGGWSYFDTDAPRQGFNGMDIYGTIWFDAAAIRSALSGKTIKQASLRLFMVKGVGRGRSVVVQLHGTNMGYNGRSGRPELTTSYGTIGTTEPDMNNEMTIPTAVIDDIVSGKIQALVLKSDDTVEYKDKFYSENYARFEGSTSNTTADNCPRLTVVYQ